MRRPGTLTALDLYDDLAEPGTGVSSKTQSQSLVLAHAVLRPLSGPQPPFWGEHAITHPVFLDASEQQRAACGLRMKVVLPNEFDDADDEACGRCRIEVSRWALNPGAWWREQRRWEQRKRVADDGEGVAVWRAMEDRHRSAMERRAQIVEPDG
jgi:hypothetical protein